MPKRDEIKTLQDVVIDNREQITVHGEIIDRQPVPPQDELEDLAIAAGWSKDPGTGKAFHLPDGREVLNPASMAPSVGFVKQESIMDQVNNQIRAAAAAEALMGAIDETPEEAMDYGPEDDEENFLSDFQFIVMMEDYPGNQGQGDLSHEADEADKKRVEEDPGEVPPPDPKKKKKAPPPDDDLFSLPAA